MSEISDLKSQLNTLKSTCDELRLKTKRQEHEDKDGVDEESRVLKEKIAELMSDGYVTVAPRQHSIIKHLKLLTDNVRSHNMVIVIFVYLISDIPRNLTLLTSTMPGGTHSRHAEQRYIGLQKTSVVNGKPQTALSG